MTGTSALDITVARTPQIPVMDILVHFCDIYSVYYRVLEVSSRFIIIGMALS